MSEFTSNCSSDLFTYRRKLMAVMFWSRLAPKYPQTHLIRRHSKQRKNREPRHLRARPNLNISPSHFPQNANRNKIKRRIPLQIQIARNTTCQGVGARHRRRSNSNSYPLHIYLTYCVHSFDLIPYTLLAGTRTECGRQPRTGEEVHLRLLLPGGFHPRQSTHRVTNTRYVFRLTCFLVRLVAYNIFLFYKNFVPTVYKKTYNVE